LLCIKQLVQLATGGSLALPKSALNLKALMRVRAATFQRTTASLKIPLARFAKFCSVRGANSEQSAMSPRFDQGISNGSRFAVYSAQSCSPYYSVCNFSIGFSFPDACNVFLATIGNATQIQLSSEMHRSPTPRCNSTRYSSPSSRNIKRQIRVIIRQTFVN
jgi:hypothetical protein